MPAKGSTLVAIVNGEKRCGRCCTWKPVANYHKASTRGNHGFQGYCKACANAHRADVGRSAKAKDPALYLWKSARGRASVKRIPFTILPADVSVPERCPVLDIVLKPAGRGQPGGMDASPSIDRIDNDLGYVPGNILVVSWRANRLKSDATPSELTAVANFYDKVSAYAR